MFCCESENTTCYENKNKMVAIRQECSKKKQRFIRDDVMYYERDLNPNSKSVKDYYNCFVMTGIQSLFLIPLPKFFHQLTENLLYIPSISAVKSLLFAYTSSAHMLIMAFPRPHGRGCYNERP